MKSSDLGRAVLLAGGPMLCTTAGRRWVSSMSRPADRDQGHHRGRAGPTAGPGPTTEEGARQGQGGAPQAWVAGSVTCRVWFPEDPRSFRPRVTGGVLENSLYQNTPPSQDGQPCLAPGASVLPSLTRARLPDGCLL